MWRHRNSGIKRAGVDIWKANPQLLSMSQSIACIADLETAMAAKGCVLGDTDACSPLKMDLRFVGIFYLYFLLSSSYRIIVSLILLRWWTRIFVPLKLRLICIRWQHFYKKQISSMKFIVISSLICFLFLFLNSICECYAWRFRLLTDFHALPICMSRSMNRIVFFYFGKHGGSPLQLI